MARFPAHVVLGVAPLSLALCSFFGSVTPHNVKIAGRMIVTRDSLPEQRIRSLIDGADDRPTGNLFRPEDDRAVW